MKRLLVVAGLVAALVGGIIVAAGAGAQENTPAPSPSGEADEERTRPFEQFLDRLAENLGISRADLDATIDETQLELIDEAVAEGRLDEEKAAELKERIENGEPVFPGFGGPHHHPRPFFHGLGWLMGTAAELLGLEKDELREQLAEGNSLADIAAEQGIDVEQLKTDLLAAAKEDLDSKVAEGDLTQERADRVYDHFSENIDRIVNFERELELEMGEPGLEESFRFEIRPDGGMPPLLEDGTSVPPFGGVEPWFGAGEMEEEAVAGT